MGFFSFLNFLHFTQSVHFVIKKKLKKYLKLLTYAVNTNHLSGKYLSSDHASAPPDFWDHSLEYRGTYVIWAGPNSFSWNLAYAPVAMLAKLPTA